MKPARLSRDELKARLGISERLAVRVGALRSRGVELTLAVLEEAAAGEDLKKLLLSPGLLEGAKELTAEALKAMGGVAADLTMVPAAEGGGRIVALEEEVLAEGASEGAETRGLPAEAASLQTLEGKMPSVLGDDEARRLFQPEEIARLKLTLLTGVDPAEKIEALRRLAYAPLPVDEKGMLALKCLGDTDAGVRREAATSLHALGLDRELAEALAGFAKGTGRQRALALEKIASLSGRLREFERRVAVSSIVAALRDEGDRHVLREMARALRPYADMLRANAEFLSLLSRHIVRVMVEYYDAVASEVRALFDAVAEGAGEEAAAVVWKETE
ncbi:MAG: hypothetical protein ACYTAF_03255, partial [Planctomycetota bacterium]